MSKPLDFLFNDAEAAAKLRLADRYITQKELFGSNFVLPAEHRALDPIIARYSGALPEFVKYVKAVRDAAPAKSRTYDSPHELYRTLNVRLVQQDRRDRAGRALAWLEKYYPKLTYDQRVRWIRKVEQQWGQRRMASMDDARRKTERGRLATDEREVILRKFWETIDAEIAEGDLPKP